MIPNKKTITILLCGTCICIGMLILRMVQSRTPTFDYMVINLFLAWMPLFLSTLLLVIYRKKRQHVSPYIFTILFLFWFLFFPNAPYMVTDLIHIKVRGSTPVWYDALMLQMYALMGLLLGFLSLSQIQTFLHIKMNRKHVHYITIFFLFLTSIGVSLGRFFRWNSWDLVFSPKHTISQLLISHTNIPVYIEFFSFIPLFFAILLLMYYFLLQVGKPED